MKREEQMEQIRLEFTDISRVLNEKSIRWWCASKARSYNRLNTKGGVSIVSAATGISRSRIHKGLKEIELVDTEDTTNRLRKNGGGRKKITENQPTLLDSLDKMISPLTRGDPESPLRWTCKSTYKLQEALEKQGYEISASSVGNLLKELGYSLQAPSKTDEEGEHKDRDAQFQQINDKVSTFQEKGYPAISVDAKKKENVGNYGNKGREYQLKGQPDRVKVYDFPTSSSKD